MKPTVKSELDFVYITSAGTRYLNRLDALCAEGSIQQAREFKQKKTGENNGLYRGNAESL